MADPEITSIEPSPQGVPLWTSAVGADYDIVAKHGFVARAFSVAVGGTLVLTFGEGNARACAVVGGKDYIAQVRSVHASGSTAYGLIFWK